MAAIINSNSFILTTAPNARRSFKSHRRQFAVYAKSSGTFSSFRLGKSSNESPSSDDAPAEDSANSNPFRFAFGKVPDVKSLIPVVGEPSSGLSFGNARRKDSNTVFVAGATGQAGIRLAQTLLREGFSVRAGVPELGAAQELARLAAKYKVISNEESKRLNAVESSFQDAEAIAKAIGNASKVVVTIGAGENGPTSEVTTSDALQVIQAAQLAGVSHVAIVYDGNASSSSTYNVLDGLSSFFNNLFSRSQPLSVVELLQKIAETDVGYTFIKTNLVEDFAPERAYNVVVGAEGSVSSNDYKVAKSQIASLVAGVFSNTAVAENKVVEVYSSPSAPSSSVDQLFSAIPTDGRRQAYAEAQAKAKAEEEAIRTAEKAREEAEAAKKQEVEAAKAKRLSEKVAAQASPSSSSSLTEESQKQESDQIAFFNSFLNKAKDFSSEQSQKLKKLSEKEPRPAKEEAPEKADNGANLVNDFFNKAKGFGSAQPWEKLAFQLPKASEESNAQIATVRGQAKARALPPKKASVRQTQKTNSKPSFALKQKENSKPKAAAKEETKAEVRKVFGGLFKQETIYVDDD
ncbi:protein PLASTID TRANSCRIPTIONALLY ACTIVE 16, chloroplastic [Benincasa hispida]|uniref:protein PLASTID TRANSCRIPTIONALLY ACTIVE 16, chloroplastic n=1 Tax=Benincasa hispida TaxID=102211 RepID=UPI0018FF1190|nr:protein PLASTID TRANSCRIPTIONALLY ACTIVE 16, chloroplastic [Benincasa hispida]